MVHPTQPVQVGPPGSMQHMAPMAPVAPVAPVVPVAPVAPMYAAPPPPPPQAAPTVITVVQNNDDDTRSLCPTCGRDTSTLTRKVVGGVALAWFCCMLWTLGWTGLCFMPCRIDSCKDTELVCMRCQTVKQKISANCF